MEEKIKQEYRIVPHTNNLWVRIYIDASGEYWPYPNSLWSYYEYARLLTFGIDVEFALKFSQPILSEEIL